MKQFPRWQPELRVGLSCLLASASLPRLIAADQAGTANTPQATVPVGANESTGGAEDEFFSLAAYNVQADRLEDFGFRVGTAVTGKYPKTAAGALLARYGPIVTAVLPNTAAAKAGLQPGDRILKADGRGTSIGLFSAVEMKSWRRADKAKWAELAEGKASVTWTFEIRPRGSTTTRVVKLVVPTPAPRWGASVWQAPEGRAPASVTESGPLAERARAVLDHGVWAMLEDRHENLFGLDFRGGIGSDFLSGTEPLAYTWSIEGGHTIFVTQFRGRTDILLQTRSPLIGTNVYLTSPSGKLESAWRWSWPRPGKNGVITTEEAKAGFEHELDLWTTKVGKVSPRWPFELKPGYDANAIFATLAPKQAVPNPAVTPPKLAKEFLALRTATEAERTLFTEAYAKLGAEADRWAYTETSRAPDDKHVRTVRVDPSKPEAERMTLLAIDGRSPTAAETEDWRDDHGDMVKPLGDLPPLASLVELNDLRVLREEEAAIVFETAIRGGGAGFPPEKFQALFRVGRAHRALEEVAITQRGNVSLGGMATLVDAGWQIRLQTIDPAYPPQPVLLKGGGAARILLVKVARDFETTRTDFTRVSPNNPAGTEGRQ